MDSGYDLIILCGIILNILSLFVLCKIKEDHAIYKYYKVYSMNGVIYD